MSAPATPAPSRSRNPVRLLLGVLLAFVVASGAFVSAATMASGPGWWSGLVLAMGVVLMVAALKNWPILWNLLGRLLRSLLGERGARAAFALVGFVVMVPGGVWAADSIVKWRTSRIVNAPDGHFPLDIRDTASVEIRLSRSACFGWCPVYDVVVSGEGLARFTGRDHVDSLQPAPLLLSRPQLAALLQAFERVDYQALGDYSSQRCSPVTDMPDAYTSLRFDGREKQVAHYLGCDRAPLALTRLEARIDSIVGVQRWVGEGGKTRGGT